MNRKQWIVTAAALMLGQASFLFADDRNNSESPATRPSDAQADRDSGRQADGGAAARNPAYLRLHRATEVVGKPVKNSEGQDLGRIEEVVVDTRTGKIRYAVLSFGGLLGIGTKFFALPWDALHLQPYKQTEQLIFIFDVDKSRLENAPGFDKTAWPDVANEEWGTSVYAYWKPESERNRMNRGSHRTERQADKHEADNAAEHSKHAGKEKDATTGNDSSDKRPADKDNIAERRTREGQPPLDPNVKRLRKLNAELINRDVKDTGFSDLGDAEDLMIDIERGQIVYLIVEFDDTKRVRNAERDGKKDLLFPIPYQAVSMRKDPHGDNDTYVLNMPVERINTEMPRFPKDNWPSMHEMQWNEGVFHYYQIRPEWGNHASVELQVRED